MLIFFTNSTEQLETLIDFYFLTRLKHFGELNQLKLKIVSNAIYYGKYSFD